MEDNENKTGNEKTEKVQKIDNNRENYNQDTVIIEATRTNSTRNEQAYELNVVDRDELNKTQAQDLKTALKIVPGLAISRGPRGQGQQPIIRGLTGNRVL